MLQYTHLLVFELGHTCNYADIHPLCPVSIREKSERTLTDELIISLAKQAYNELGFTGLIAWHFYNEPMLVWKRMLPLMEKIRKEVPKSRFLLWTNGSVLINDPRINMFEQVKVTDYKNRGEALYRKYYKNNLSVNPEMFDSRLTYGGTFSKRSCLRPFTEFIISSFGEVHLCCQDWQGRVKIGNVFDTDLKELDERKEKISLSICNKMDDSTPETCLRCVNRFGLNTFDPEITKRTMIFLAKANFK